MATKKTAKKGGAAMALGVIGASAAGLAAAYYFLGPKGKVHQKHARAWAIKMKGEVVEKLEDVKEVTPVVYHEIIDSVTKEYKKGKKASQAEIDALAADLKKHWKTIAASAKVAGADMKKATKKVVAAAKGMKKAAKKR